MMKKYKMKASVMHYRPALLMIVGLIFLVFLIASCAPRVQIDDKEDQERQLREKLGIQTQIKWSHDVINQVRHFDSQGRMINELWLNPKGTIVTSRVLEYDKRIGRPEYVVWYKGTDILRSSYRYSFDKRGNMSEELWLTPFDEIQTRTEYEYDNGNLLRETKYDRNDNVINITEYRYEDDNLVELSVTDRRDRLTNRHLYDYDASGNLLEERWFNEKDELETRRVYTYRNGRLSSKAEYRNGEFFHKLLYEYDHNGMILRESWQNEDEEIFFENHYTYDYF